MISLSMITNNAEATADIVAKYGEYFDKFFITFADKNKKELMKFTQIGSYSSFKMNLSYFKWEDNFGKAREYNRQQIDTEYFMWIDSDDEIVNPENIPDLVRYMENMDLDALYMRYDYQKNDLGEATGDHWRERIVKTNHFKWATSRVHETLLAPSANTQRIEETYVQHNKTAEDEMKSLDRNIRLLKLDFEDTHDPRTAMYLGDNLVVLKEYDEALKYLTFHLQNSGWEEDKYRSWLKVAEILYLKESYGDALQATFSAEELLPDWPDAFFLRATIYKELDKPKNIYECVKTGLLKKKPETLSVVNPTLYEYKALFLGAIAAAELGKIEEAYKMLKIVRMKSPDYQPAKDLFPIIEEAFEDSTAIEKITWLMYYLKNRGGKAQKLMESLPMRVFSDPRLNPHRVTVFPPKKWDKGSIAYYCGMTGEVWGADTLEKGMGGSEEAVVYLSRELAKLGHQVTVFNERDEEYEDILGKGETNGVKTMELIYSDMDGLAKPRAVNYKPWTLLNPNDEFDTFIAWRAPENIRGVKAKNKFVDLHDTVEAERVYSVAEIEPDVKFFVKSNYHRSLYPDLPDDRFIVVGNGILRSQFNEN